MKLDFEYGHGLMSANLPDDTDVFIPGKTMPASGLGQPVRGYSGFPAASHGDGAAAGAGDSR